MEKNSKFYIKQLKEHADEQLKQLKEMLPMIRANDSAKNVYDYGRLNEIFLNNIKFIQEAEKEARQTAEETEDEHSASDTFSEEIFLFSTKNKVVRLLTTFFLILILAFLRILLLFMATDFFLDFLEKIQTYFLTTSMHLTIYR